MYTALNLLTPSVTQHEVTVS